MPNSSLHLQHGDYADLDANTHPQYLLTGGDTLIGDLPVNTDGTLDGVDLNPDVGLWGLL